MPDFYEQIMANPEAVFDFPYGRGYELSNAQLDNFHRHWLQKRFEQLRPKVPVLAKLAADQRVEKISGIAEAAPLLFTHTVYKSYPMSYLERGRFDALTKWLSKLTTTDLSAVDAAGVGTIDDWIDLLDEKTELMLLHTTGTSGKLSFFPRTRHQTRLMARQVANAFRGWEGPDSHADMLKEHRPLINPSHQYGAGMNQRNIQIQIEMFTDGPEHALFLYPGQRLSADLLSLGGRLRTAEARGEAGSLQIPPGLLRRRDELIEQEKRRPQAMSEFLKSAQQRFARQDIYVTGVYPMFYDWAVQGLADGYRNVFGPDSFALMGGGTKGRQLPDGWKQTITEFLGFTTMMEVYGMTECMGLAMLCEEGKYHFSPLTIPYLLDPKTGELLPRKDGTFGRYAFFDLIPDNFWAGMVTGDAITIGGFETPCKCGRTGYYAEKDIRRFSELEGGDDKVLCSGAPEAHDRASAFLAES